MPLDPTASDDALYARADRAIADAIALRARVRASLTAAGQRRVHRPYVEDLRPVEAPPLGPPLPSSFIEPWWSIARALADAGEIIRQADRELDLAWHRILPSIETPMNLFGS